MTGKIHSFETFGTVDGPGTRFVIFFKGCPLRCLYCHNPDTWSSKDAKEYTVQEIVEEVLKYKKYYEKGGVTATGGEPLKQLDFLIELFKELKKHNIHTAIDTSGALFSKSKTDKYDELLKFTDLFLLDIKHIDNEEHKKLTGVNNKNTLTFAKYLDDNNKKIWIRHVLVPGITTQEKYLKDLKLFLDNLNNVEKVEILPYHTLGVNKYKKLGLDYPLKHIEPPSQEEIQFANDILKRR